MTVLNKVGTYRQTAALSAPGPNVPDGDGGFTQSYVPLSPATWRCAIDRVSPGRSERKFAGTVTAHATHVLTGRYHPDITTTTRITWTDRAGAVHVANVLDVDDPEGAGVETVAMVSEVAP